MQIHRMAAGKMPRQQRRPSSPVTVIQIDPEVLATATAIAESMDDVRLELRMDGSAWVVNDR